MQNASRRRRCADRPVEWRQRLPHDGNVGPPGWNGDNHPVRCRPWRPRWV